MKTVVQIAKEIGVSRQAVYRKMKQEPLSTSLQEYLSTLDNKVYISVDGESLIKSAFNKNNVSNTVTQNGDNSDKELTARLQEEIHFLRSQNEELRREISKLTAKVLEQSERLLTLTEQAQKLAENAQTLHAMENVKPQLTEGKKGFFSRIFKN